MSFDLAFWTARDKPSVREAVQIYERLADGELGVIESSPAVSRFVDELVKIHPDLTSANMEESIWASPIYSSAEAVVLSLVWSRANEARPFILDLAERCSLVGFDPQAESVLP